MNYQKKDLILGMAERIQPGTVSTLTRDITEVSKISFEEIAKNRLLNEGINPNVMEIEETIKRALSTTDFPDLFKSAIERILLKNYETKVQPWQMIARKEYVKDFRTHTGIKIDGKVSFEEIPEDGEYSETPLLGNEKAALNLKKFGRKFSVTYESLVNDDLGAIRRIHKMIQLGAEQFQAEKIWGLIINNEKTPDGKELFHADHKNYKSVGGSVPSLESLSEARTAMRRQVSPQGNLLGLVPRYLIVPPELQTTAEQLVSNITANKTGDVNVFAGAFDVIVCDLLTDTKAWYLAADPKETTVEGLTYSYLANGTGIPNIDTIKDFNTDSFNVKTSLSFGVSAWGYQGWYKNKGE